MGLAVGSQSLAADSRCSTSERSFQAWDAVHGRLYAAYNVDKATFRGNA